MDALKRFEELLESMVEGSLAEALTGHLQPVEIAKRLARAMDGGQTITANALLVPNDYTVHVSAGDYEMLAPFRQSLERELVTYLRDLAREQGARFLSAPRVTIIQDRILRARRMRVVASLRDAEPATPEIAPAQATAALPVAEVRSLLERSARLLLGDGRAISLDKPVTSIGRNLDNDIVIEDRRVSRRHAQIRFQHKSFCLYDLSSANGTTVNGQRIEQVVLRDGDRISLGGVEMAFHRSSRETRRGA